MGLTQKALAGLAGLARSTIIEIESGKIKDLSFSRTAALLDVLGLGLTISPAHPRLKQRAVSMLPLETAARTASVSYSQAMPASVLGESLCTGQVPVSYAPHVGTLLEEAPVSMLAKAVEQLHADLSVPRDKVWKNMRRLASNLKVMRDIWSA
jgi:transcriptional regulator with XRE-family HTH domain